MKNATVTVYEFSELSATAKARAIAEHEAALGFTWADDHLESLKALAAHFGGALAEYSVDWAGCSHSSACFDMPEMEPAVLAEKVAALGTFNPETLKGHGDCVLTGFCGDESAIDGLRIAYTRDGERDLSALMQAASGRGSRTRRPIARTSPAKRAFPKPPRPTAGFSVSPARFTLNPLPALPPGRAQPNQRPGARA